MNYFTDGDSKWREMVEGYELSDGTVVFAAVEFTYSSSDGLVAKKLAYLDESGFNIQTNDFSYDDQMWLASAVAKDVNRFQNRNYEAAETAYRDAMGWYNL